MRRLQWAGLVLAGLAALAAVTMSFGGRLLVVQNPLPERAQAIVVLAGSGRTSRIRHEEAMRLLREGVADHVVISVRKAFYWGAWIPQLARDFVEEEYGSEVLEKHLFCDNDADSTAEEALALERCLGKRRFRSVVLVTSDYHTRRARLIWDKVLVGMDDSLEVAIHGVPDGDFESKGWWRTRRHAKTWVLEVSKLMWSLIEGVPSEAPSNADDRGFAE